MIGENFPYTNFHDLNLDWIIKIAKDFLDQYTGIQQTITEGLEDLDAKAEEIQGHLDAWYETHSWDIAQQLADALLDLNAWYTEHSGYLDSALSTNIAAFNAAAEAKGQEVLDSIPDTYTGATNAQKMTASLTGNRWYSGYYLVSTGSWVQDDAYRLSNFIPCFPGDKFIYCGISSQQNRYVIRYFDSTGAAMTTQDYNLGTDYTEIECTVPTGACYMRFLAATAHVDDTYIIYGKSPNTTPMMGMRKAEIANANAIAALQRNVGTVYVDGSAQSNGSGTAASPFNTLAAAFNSGAKNIRAKAGVYPESIYLEDRELNLSLWSDIIDYDYDVPNREKIVLFNGAILTPTETGMTYTASYTPVSGTRFYKVFVTQELPPITEGSLYSEEYNTTLFLWSPGHISRRYKPVLYAEFDGTPGTFTYNQSTVIVAPYSTDSLNEDIYISYDLAFPLNINRGINVYISDVAVLGSWFNGLKNQGGKNTVIKDCEFACNSHGSGAVSYDGNITFENCLASGCSVDGFGFGRYDSSALYNCSAYYCGDDGCSHHQGCKGFISGGEYAHNVSGGITPAFGANVNIEGAITRFNGVGIQLFGAQNVPIRQIKITNCMITNNTDEDIYNDGYNPLFFNCVYSTMEQAAGYESLFINCHVISPPSPY